MASRVAIERVETAAVEREETSEVERDLSTADDRPLIAAPESALNWPPVMAPSWAEDILLSAAGLRPASAAVEMDDIWELDRAPISAEVMAFS